MRNKYIYPMILAAIFLLLMGFSVSGGHLYGSNTDWLSQHVTLAETIRDACREQHTPAPAFLPLGGGSNGFMFSYYGYFRPDILIGCLLPQVPMIWIVTGYSLLGYLASVWLFYLWLSQCGHKGFMAFLGSLLFLTAGCFFQTHRQVMFINYMPFLMMALIAVHKRKFPLAVGAMALIYLHSFYYAIACLAVIGWYWYEEEGRRFWRAYVRSALLSIGMAAVLLIPTGLVILEHKRLSAGGGPGDVMELNPRAFLYSPYGMGLTAICLYCILLGLGSRKYRKKSIAFLIISFWMGAAWLLNGTLYARAKILIPFIPLIILHTVRILTDMYRREIETGIWPLVPIVIFTAGVWGQKNFVWMAADAGIVGVSILIFRIQQRRGLNAVNPDDVILGGKAGINGYSAVNLLCLALLLGFPCLMYLHTAESESYVKPEKYENYTEKEAFAKTCGEEMEKSGSTLQLEEYRMEDLSMPMDSCNALYFAGQQKTSMYSSVTNQDYSKVYYDILRTPIRINNRVALLPEENPFLQQLMGIRYLLSEKGYYPAGYRTIWEKDGYILSENENVLPVAYVTAACMSEEQFEKMDKDKQAEAMTRYTIVPEGEWCTWHPATQDFSPDWKMPVMPDTVQVSKNGGGYTLEVKEDTQIELNLRSPLCNQILLMEFDVEEADGKAVTIDIGGVRNKKSARTAPYPNGNGCFQYQFASGESLEKLQVQLSKGNYKITDIRYRTLDMKYLTEKEYTAAVFDKKEKNRILSCRINPEEEGYFVTSIPLQKGMKLYVDGEETKIEKVNGAFAGCRINPGSHEIWMTFTPPGYRTGLAVSILSLLAFFFAGRRKSG